MTVSSHLLAWAERHAAQHVNARGEVGPDFAVGMAEDPQLERWWLIPHNRAFNVYLHRFRRGDDNRAVHDHPWASLGWILGPGGYNEIVRWEDGDGVPYEAPRWRRAGSLTARGPRFAHRVVLPSAAPVWTLFVTGPSVREWGFWCEHGWRPWREFVEQRPGGNSMGRGCE